MSDECFASSCDEALDRLRAVATRYPVEVAGVALIELLAQWICSHRGPCPTEERAFRQELVEFQIGQLREFVAMYSMPDML